MVLIFGLYHVPHQKVSQYISGAHSLGIKNFDTAQLYRNEKVCVESCNKTDKITTKIYEANTAEDIEKLVKRSENRFGSKTIDCMLLHRRMPTECWTALSQQTFPKMGISNYDIPDIKELLEHCEQNNLKVPNVHQMEVHPFTNCCPTINFCKENNIEVQGHTILAQGKFLNYPPLAELASKYSVSSAAILAAWAASKNIDLCINSGNIDHLREIVNATSMTLSEDDLAEIDMWHAKAPHTFYNKTKEYPRSLEDIDRVVSKLKQEMLGSCPSDLCETLPLAGTYYRSIGKNIACKLFPDVKHETALTKYRALIKKMRHQRVENNKTALLNKKGLSCCVIRRLTGSYSESISNPKPMPVDVTDPDEFIPFFDFLKTSDHPPNDDAIFVRGAMFPDGRMDLCKQVVGPRSIGSLCDTVRKSKIVKHFLLGNNVALQENEEDGANALASVMSDNSKPIETWYLAGNCIGPSGTRIISTALSKNTQCRALWLKRNPIGHLGAESLNLMLRQNTNLVLLDLHNCAIGNEGLKNLLVQSEQIKRLKHLYLDANGIDNVDSLRKWIKIGTPVTLYISINRLGDKQIIKLAKALRHNQHIKRLCLASCHMHNEGLREIVKTALTCPKLKSLNLGCYKSSADLGEHPGNFFDDDIIPDITTLLTQSSSLKYFNVMGSQISKDGLLSLPKLQHISMDLGYGPSHHVHEKSALRFLKQPKRVVHIDSIYRGKM